MGFGGINMKFKNISNKSKRFKTAKGWVEVQPQCTIELGMEADKNERGLEKLIVTPSYNKTEKRIVDTPQPRKLPRSEAFKQEFKSKEELEKMTKDELNDFAAVNGLKKQIKHSMKKATMIEKIIKYFKEKW